MSVAVISKTGMVLMPTSEYRARRLLNSGKAMIYGYRPFTIVNRKENRRRSAGGTVCGYRIYPYWSICKVREARIPDITGRYINR